LGSAASASGVDDKIARIQKAYDGFEDISGRFVQKNDIRELKRTDTYRGGFYIKPPKMKWEYAGDKAQVIYVNDDRITIYQKKDKQVIRARFDKATYGQAPIALLAGLGDIRNEFEVSAGKGNRIVLKPKNAMGSIVRVELAVADHGFPIKSITIYDKVSNVITITLSNVRMNTGIKDSTFSFRPPKGAKVLDN
jgi:outer membrane lipoprotein-sorting protein